MKIFTKAQATSVTKYYSELLIGKPIFNPGNSNPYPITYLEATKLKENEYEIICYSKYLGNVWHRHLDEVITDTDVLPLKDLLSSLNL